MSERSKLYEEKMEKTLRNLDGELQSVRAGRANPHVLDKIRVDYYGSPTPIQQVANVSVPEARIIQIAPEERPLQKLPPPMTIAVWMPSSTIFFTCFATAVTVASSNPVFLSPASASPLSFSNTRLIWPPINVLSNYMQLNESIASGMNNMLNLQ